MEQIPIFPKEPDASQPMDKKTFYESRPTLDEASFLEGIPNKHLVKNKNYESFDIYIGRGSAWGNPFVIGPDGSRQEVIDKYRRHLWFRLQQGDLTIDQLLALDGQRLGCFCSPRPCHGHILQLAITWAKKQRDSTMNDR